MKKSIATLSEDIYGLLNSGYELTSNSGGGINVQIEQSISRVEKPREKGKLWASDLGKKCMRYHWFNFNEDAQGESLQGHTRFKFLYGNILEEVVLDLAKLAGHEVTHEQHVVEYQVNDDWTLRGRTDAVIDNVLIDVKTASSYAYKKYSLGITEENDSFGYLYQLGFYAQDDELSKYTDPQGYVFIDKQNGHIKYVEAEIPTKEQVIARAKAITNAVSKDSAEDVPRGYDTKPYGKSGNRTLDIACAYCKYKRECWPGLRTFIYGHGPVDFTEIVNEPRVPEVHNDQ